MIYYLLVYTTPLAFVLPLVVILTSNNKYRNELRVIGFYVILSFFIQLISYVFWAKKLNNLFLLHIYTLLEFVVISIFYGNLFRGSIKKWLIPLLMFVFVVGVLADGFFIHGFENFNNYARSIECLLIISYAIYYFYKELSEGKMKNTFKEPILLINSAFLFYFSSSFFLFLFSNVITQAEFTRHLLWSMHTIAAWILYTTIGIALWKAGKK